MIDLLVDTSANTVDLQEHRRFNDRYLQMSYHHGSSTAGGAFPRADSARRHESLSLTHGFSRRSASIERSSAWRSRLANNEIFTSLHGLPTAWPWFQWFLGPWHGPPRGAGDAVCHAPRCRATQRADSFDLCGRMQLDCPPG